MAHPVDSGSRHQAYSVPGSPRGRRSVPRGLYSRLSIAAVLIAGLIATGGCARSAGPEVTSTPEVAEVRVVPPELALAAGAGGQLAAQVDDATGHPIGGARIAFSSADTHLVTVSGLGFVTSVGPAGHTSIRVVSGSQQGIVPVRVTAGVPQHVQITGGDHQNGIAGFELPDLLQVHVTDAYANPVPGCRVRFTLLPTTGSPVDSVCNIEGAAQARISLPDEAGPVTVTAVANGSGQAKATFTLDAQAGPPAHMGIIEPAGEAKPARGSVVRAAVRVTDGHSNGVSGVTVLWSILQGGGRVDPASSTTDASGIAATHWSLGKLPRGNALRVTLPQAKLAPLDITVTPQEVGFTSSARDSAHP